MARSSEDWRRRLAGRIAFDQAAAEASIRRAYRASTLPEPEQILWARGPREAAEALRFLRQPPGRQRWLGLALMAGGAVLWPSLALVIDEADWAHDPVNAATLIGAIAAYYLARLSARSLPVPPHRAPGISRGGAILSGVTLYAVLIGVLVAVQHFRLPADPLARGSALALTLVLGTLPGILLLLRLQQVLQCLPASLQSLAPARSVARSLLRSRDRALSFPAHSHSAARPHQPLLEVYQSAYAEAFTRSGELLPPLGSTGPIGQARLGDEALWMMPGLMRHIEPTLFPIPAYLDGIEDAEAVFAAEGGSTSGSAAFEDLAFHVDRLFPFRNVALAVRPATTVAIDAEGRPHAEGGPALAWADGTRVHAWRGRVTDEDLVDTQTPLTLSRVMSERDRSRRWILIERYGLGRFLTESRASQIQRDECGTLYHLEQQRDEPIVAVRVVNSTAEPDGSFRDFWLRVPPNMRTARQAVAWTFGLSADEYVPAAQS